MSYNEDDEGWQTVGGERDRRSSRNDDNEARSENAWGNRRPNEGDDRDRRPPQYDGNQGRSNETTWGHQRQEDERRPRHGRENESDGQSYQPDTQDFPSLGEEEQPRRRQNQVDEQSTWRPQRQQLSSHTEEHKVQGVSGFLQEHKESMFSMRGMFSALKKTVKAKIHELADDLRQNFKLPANEQRYSETVSSDIDIEPTGDEIDDIRLACSKLWDLDLNRLTPGQDYAIDCGDGKKMYQREDMEENALFRHLDPGVFRRPTYARFVALLDNYNAQMNVSERKSAQEDQEERAFIEEISRTAPILYVQKYLATKGIIRGGDEQFKNMLHELWFKLVDRNGTDDSSSSFEHVFVGEIKKERDGNTEVSGLHNWIQFYLEEAKGNLDYQGFILPRRRGDQLPDAHTQLITVQFNWKGYLKPLSSTLIGVSPEFEFALYTLCFYCGAENNHVELGPYSVNIKVYPMGRTLGSAFPIAEE